MYIFPIWQNVQKWLVEWLDSSGWWKESVYRFLQNDMTVKDILYNIL